MNMNRRKLLQLFGVGATVVPIIGGAASLDTPAKLIEVPKLDLLPPLPMPSLSLGEDVRITIETGNRTYRAFGLLETISRPALIDVTSHQDPHHTFIPGGNLGDATFTFTGRLLELRAVPEGI